MFVPYLKAASCLFITNYKQGSETNLAMNESTSYISLNGVPFLDQKMTLCYPGLLCC